MRDVDENVMDRPGRGNVPVMNRIACYLTSALCLVGGCSKFLAVGALPDDEGETSGGDGDGDDDANESGSLPSDMDLDLDGEPRYPPEPDPSTFLPSGPSTEVVVASGTRLRAVVLRDDDAVSFVRWYDTELDLDCEFLPTAAGLRCLPSQYVFTTVGPGCDTPVANVPPEGEAPLFVIELVEGNCDAEYRAWVLDGSPPFAPDPSCYFGDDEPPAAVRRVVEAPLETFVGASVRTTEATGYGTRRLETDDGAWRSLGPSFDGIPCEYVDLDGEGRCVDHRGGPSFLCPGQSLACEATIHGLDYGGPCMDRVVAVRSVGSAVVADTVCAGWTGVAQPLGATIPSADLPAAEVGLVGRGRVRVRSIGDAASVLRWPDDNDQNPTPPWRLFDTRLGLPCRADTFSPDVTDGPVVCTPRYGLAYPEQYFADPECTVPAYTGPIRVDAFEGPEVCEFSGILQGDPILGWVNHGGDRPTLHGVVRHDGPIYAVEEDRDRCEMTARPSQVSGMFRPAGGPLPVDDVLPTIELVTLPLASG